MTLSIDSDNRVTLAHLKTDTDIVPNTATVTVRVFDLDGRQLGADYDMSNVADGKYQGILPASLPLKSYTGYYVRVVAEFNGLQKSWETYKTAERDGFV